MSALKTSLVRQNATILTWSSEINITTGYWRNCDNVPFWFLQMWESRVNERDGSHQIGLISWSPSFRGIGYWKARDVWNNHVDFLFLIHNLLDPEFYLVLARYINNSSKRSRRFFRRQRSECITSSLDFVFCPWTKMDMSSFINAGAMLVYCSNKPLGWWFRQSFNNRASNPFRATFLGISFMTA